MTRTWKIYLTLGILLTLYFGLFLQGMPYEQEAALRAWMLSTEMPWGQLLGHLFNPQSESLLVHNEIAVQVRVTEHVILKALYDVFKDSLHLAMIHNLTFAVLLGLLIFRFTQQWTQSTLAGFLTVLFLLTTPAYGWAIMEYGDFSPIDQVFLLIYLGVFIRYYQSRVMKGPTVLALKDAVLLAALWLLGMLAIRTKEPNMFLVPGLSWFIFFLNPSLNFFRSSKEQKIYKFLPLAGLLSLLTLPILLVREKASNTPFNPEFLKDPLRILFCNPIGYVPETRSSLFSLEFDYPSSIVSTYGFFLSWAVIGCTLFTLWLWLKSKNKFCPNRISIPFLLIGWTGVALAFFIPIRSGLSFTRYMIWALLPFTFLNAIVFVRFVRSMPGKFKPAAAAALVIMTLGAVVTNANHSFYARKGLERIWRAKWTFREDVMKDREKISSVRLFDLSRYWYPRPDFLRAIEPYLFHEDGRKELAQDEKFKDILRKYGTAYVASNEPLELPWKSELINQINTSQLSALTAFKARHTKKPTRFYYLYRVQL